MAQKSKMEIYAEEREREKRVEEKTRSSREKIINAKEVVISISPIYRQRLGNTVPLTVGTETITVPVDGKTYRIKEPFAVALKQYLMQIDKEADRAAGRWGTESGDVSGTGPLPKLGS